MVKQRFSLQHDYPLWDKHRVQRFIDNVVAHYLNLVEGFGQPQLLCIENETETPNVLILTFLVRPSCISIEPTLRKIHDSTF